MPISKTDLLDVFIKRYSRGLLGLSHVLLPSSKLPFGVIAESVSYTGCCQETREFITTFNLGDFVRIDIWRAKP